VFNCHTVERITTTSTNPPTKFPLPAGAVRVCDWDHVEHGDPHRYWVGSSWVIDRPDHNEDIQVWIVVDRARGAAAGSIGFGHRRV
jgi:hypothetical protein